MIIQDSAATIADAREHGVQIKMVTGDDVAIGREIAGKLGLGLDIRPAVQLFKKDVDIDHLSAEAITQIEKAGGYARVFPEHKYGIVRALQSRGHIVGMTGDGVNDAPAIKQADVDIAVSGATDAARAAADLVSPPPVFSDREGGGRSAPDLRADVQLRHLPYRGNHSHHVFRSSGHGLL